MDENINRILRELECPVCNEYIWPVMPLCAIGHGVCKNCKEKCANCPVCKSNFVGGRNYMLESILSSLYIECKNKSHGCSFGGNPVLVHYHMKDCELGLYECPTQEVTSCTWNGKLSNLKKHLISKHEDISNFLFLNNFCFKVYEKNDQGLYYTCAVQYIGASSKAKDYAFKLELKRSPDKQSGFDMVLSTECIPLSLGHLNVMSDTFLSIPFGLYSKYNTHKLQVYKCKTM